MMFNFSLKAATVKNPPKILLWSLVLLGDHLETRWRPEQDDRFIFSWDVGDWDNRMETRIKHSRHKYVDFLRDEL